MAQDLKLAFWQLFSREPRPFYTGTRTNSECKQDCKNWRAEMITMDNLKAFERFIYQPNSFEIEHTFSRKGTLEDSPKLNKEYVEGQIINQIQLKNDLQQKIKDCSRKVRF